MIERILGGNFITEKELEKMSKEEFDVDTGIYMEDVHGNDGIIGRDVDGDGLIDDVEKLVKEATKRADAYNEEKARERERENQRGEREQDEKDDYAQ